MIIENKETGDARYDEILAKATELINEFWGRMCDDLEKEVEYIDQAVDGIVLPAYLTAVTNIKMKIEKLVADVGGQTWLEESPAKDDN